MSNLRALYSFSFMGFNRGHNYFVKMQEICAAIKSTKEEYTKIKKGRCMRQISLQEKEVGLRSYPLVVWPHTRAFIFDPAEGWSLAKAFICL